MTKPSFTTNEIGKCSLCGKPLMSGEQVNEPAFTRCFGKDGKPLLTCKKCREFYDRLRAFDNGRYHK